MLRQHLGLVALVARVGLVPLVLTPLLIPSVAVAQSEATLSGVVTDDSKAALPGVSVTAVDLASGRQYAGVSDERGTYRLPSVLPGAYRVQAEFAGFATVVVPRVELLVGQNVTLPLTMKVATVQETVTVTNEAPLVDPSALDVGGNIDRRQMEALPIQGRNWMELSLLVKGVTANDVAQNRPVAREDLFQLNLDGQQITQLVGGSEGFGQPRMSREAIAEYQVLTNMYDVTMGRSVGLQVQAISRAGTNQVDGSAYGYFRDDRLNAKDFVANRVLPYANQQAGFSIGGPIVRDKLQYFGTYEYEREPQTVLTRPPAMSGQSLSLPTTITQHSFLGRADYQMSPRDHIMARGTYSHYKDPFGGVVGTDYPNAASDRWRQSAIVTANWSRVLSNSAVQELKLGYYYYYWNYDLAEGVPRVSTYNFPGLSIIRRSFYPQFFWQKMPAIRYDLNWHRGSHDIKIGGEYLHRNDGGDWPNNTRGTFSFSTLPADIARRFPIDAWDDAGRWDLNGLDSSVLRYEQYFYRTSAIDIPRKTYAAWIADTWRITNRLTLNAGVRYDLDWGAMDPPGPNGTTFVDQTILVSNGKDRDNLDVGHKTGIRDFTNIAPRVGLTYKVNEGLILRGGGGVFFSAQVSNLTFVNQLNNGQNVLAMEFLNDGQPGFIKDPMRGKTAEDVLSGRVPASRQNIATIDPNYANPRTYQGTIGFQQQIGDVLGVDADLAYVRGANLGLQRDVNLFYDPVTGLPRNPNVAGRPRPEYGTISWYQSTSKSEQLALASSLTRRFRDRWQAGLTYTLTFFSNDESTGTSGYTSPLNNPFCVSCEWGRANAFQRHTLRVNGVYQAPWAVTLAGVFSYGSGNYYVTSYPGNPLGIATGVSTLNRIHSGTAPVTIPESALFNGDTISIRDRFEGPATINPGEHVPRNALRGFPLSKLDVRVSKDMAIPGTPLKVTGMFEVFNLLNHANYGSYNGVVGSATFGQPAQTANLTYLPRIVQLAFRVAF